jgi:hypothetical protein
MQYEIGNILDNVKQGLILQQVNAQGVMGSGIAKEIRARWPKVWEVYSGLVTPGDYQHTLESMGLVIPVEVEPGLVIVNLVSQHFYGKATTINGQPRRYTSYDYLDNCLSQVARINEKDQLPIHHPYIGCGLGGGAWTVVAGIIEHNLGNQTTCWSLE